MKVRNILATKGGRVITIPPEETVRQAVALLVSHRIGAVVVADADGRLVGILSERDVMRAAADDEGVFGRPVGDIMTRDVYRPACRRMTCWRWPTPCWKSVSATCPSLTKGG